MFVSFGGFLYYQRSQALDLKREEDLQDIIIKYQAYLSQNSVPPKSLDEVYGYYHHFINDSDSTNPPVDPETKKTYEYKALPDGSYQICVDFSTEKDAKVFGYQGITDGKGNQCFTVDIAKKSASGGQSTLDIPASAIARVKKTGSCEWLVSFSVKGFSPSSPLKVDAHGKLSDGCDPAKTHDYAWSREAFYETKDDGTGEYSIRQGDYGNYTYTFTDPAGKSASVSFYYTTTAIPSQWKGE